MKYKLKLKLIWPNWVNKAPQQISPPYDISLRYIFVGGFLLLVVVTGQNKVNSIPS